MSRFGTPEIRTLLRQSCGTSPCVGLKEWPIVERRGHKTKPQIALEPGRPLQGHRHPTGSSLDDKPAAAVTNNTSTSPSPTSSDGYLRIGCRRRRSSMRPRAAASSPIASTTSRRSGRRATASMISTERYDGEHQPQSRPRQRLPSRRGSGTFTLASQGLSFTATLSPVP
jgi:hypothetical protein